MVPVRRIVIMCIEHNPTVYPFHIDSNNLKKDPTICRTACPYYKADGETKTRTLRDLFVTFCLRLDRSYCKNYEANEMSKEEVNLPHLSPVRKGGRMTGIGSNLW
jgi:hypothetical protein